MCKMNFRSNGQVNLFFARDYYLLSSIKNCIWDPFTFKGIRFFIKVTQLWVYFDLLADFWYHRGVWWNRGVGYFYGNK